MGQYEGTAKGIVSRIVAGRRARAEEARACAQTAVNVIGDLQAFADDMNAALKEQKLDSDIKIQVTPWEKQMTSVVAKISVFDGGHEHDIHVEMPLSGEAVIVAGVPVPRGNSAMGAITAEVTRYLT